MNFFIYCFVSKIFRKSLLKLLSVSSCAVKRATAQVSDQDMLNKIMANFDLTYIIYMAYPQVSIAADMISTGTSNTGITTTTVLMDMRRITNDTTL